MSDRKYTSEALGRIRYSVRASQAILQYGVGAMVDFQEQTLMTADPDTWENTAVIHDERLENALQVTHFRGFNDEKQFPRVSYVRFPRWYFCPKCRQFTDIDEWKKDYDKVASKSKKAEDPNMVKKLWCPKCNVPLVVTRIVSICENGHIDDFPWVEWVHAKSKRHICGSKRLRLNQSSASSSGLESIGVTCECGAYASLGGAFSKEAFEKLEEETNGTISFRCKGYHPWNNEHEKCTCYPKAAQRGSSQVYFPYIISSLVIPPYSSRITRKIDDSRNFESFYDKYYDRMTTLKDVGVSEDIISANLRELINEYAKKIAFETELDEKTVKTVLERKLRGEESQDNSALKFRYEEYTALNGEAVISNDNTGDFLREATNIKDYALPYIKQVALIIKLREVRVLKGFTRIEPLEKSLDSKDSAKLVDIKPEGENWYPAYEVHGEGIFVEFDKDAIESWLRKNPKVIERAKSINLKFHDSFFGKESSKSISAKFILLHTVSHMLIKEVSSFCGYNIASLQERIYCAEKSKDGIDMQGILIYTAGGDSEGTLGGLVRQGRYDLFPNLFKRAVESAMYCSNDPVCSLSSGQGRDGLNLSACHSCALVPETSCEESNVFLDRGMLVGDFDDRKYGFFSEALYSENKWNVAQHEIKSDDVENRSTELVFGDYGKALESLPYKEIWTDMMVDCEETEKANIRKIIENLESLCFDEKPYENSEFIVKGKGEKYGCELLWKNKKVMYFSECSEDDYKAAQNSDWKCFYGADPNFDVEEFINSIGG